MEILFSAILLTYFMRDRLMADLSYLLMNKNK